MDKQFIGCTVSVDCGENGIYQGEVSCINSDRLIIKKAFKNGVPYPHPDSLATISCDIIEDLKILKTAEEALESVKATPSTVTVRKPVAKRLNKTVSENIVGNKLLHGSNANTNVSHGNKLLHGSNANTNVSHSTSSINNGTSSTSSSNHHHTSLHHSASAHCLGESPWKTYTNENRPVNLNQVNDINRTPNKKERPKQRWRKGERDEECFGEPINDILKKDFDFEKNLALFNKKAVYDEINAQRPDLVRQTDKQVNYRHDETVLASSPAQYRQISVPSHYLQKDYVTDEGQVVPAIPSELRRLLFNLAEDYGFSFERQSEMLGRAATEIGIQLLGGARRLNPRNSHQKPLVVVMCGSNRPGAMGLNTARQLAAHGVSTLVYLMDLIHVTTQVSQELSLYKMTGQKYTHRIQDLPTGAVDLVIMALADERTNQLNGLATSWILDCRAPILAIDPPASGTPGISVKLSIVPTLPLAHCAANGQIYLVNLAIPQKVFTELGIHYKSPFGPKFVIPLHPNE